jgi:glycosyltransferase involved in cell wall biosynthesis
MIVVNARFLTQPITGVQRYALEICRALKLLDPSIRFVAPHNIVHHALAKELGVITCGRLSGHLWEQLSLPAYLRANGKPLLLSLATTAPVLYARKIVTVHDLAFKHFPLAVSWKFRLYYTWLIPRVLRTSLHVTTVSKFSQRDICTRYGLPQQRVSVVYNATSFSGAAADPDAPKQKIIIAVGSIQPYKNIAALVAAFALFKQGGAQGYVLKLVGGVDTRVFSGGALRQAAGAGADIEYTGYLSDDALLELYRSATCFVFPSLFEGFGIPPLEAMACGCPVIASNAASIPEVCGDAVLYCDPHSVADIAARMSELVGDAQLQARLVAKGYQNLQRFSWQASAAALLAIARRHDSGSRP